MASKEQRGRCRPRAPAAAALRPCSSGAACRVAPRGLLCMRGHSHPANPLLLHSGHSGHSEVIRSAGSHRQRCLGVCSSVLGARIGAGAQAQEKLLDAYWEARGIFDPSVRRQLVDFARRSQQPDDGSLESGSDGPEADYLSAAQPLPGIPATWSMHGSAPEVLEVSRRLLSLQQLLGGSEANIDVVWMVVRQPGLLTADFNLVTQRLLDMKMATRGWAVDVLRVVEGQPALLLSDTWQVDLAALEQLRERAAQHDEQAAPATPALQPWEREHATLQEASTLASSEDASASSSNGGGNEQPQASGTGSGLDSSRAYRGPRASSAAVSSTSASATSSGRDAVASEAEAVSELVAAWQFGLSNDSLQEWNSRYGQLQRYRLEHGDCCVGYRDDDDAELGRWAAKQRSQAKSGELAAERRVKLEDIGFEFDPDEAEWVRWFRQLQAFKEVAGHASPMPLVTGGEIYLINWCAIQRIARRSRVLRESRISRLDGLGFDWTGADPLS